jgi:hypothetical protein
VIEKAPSPDLNIMSREEHDRFEQQMERECEKNTVLPGDPRPAGRLWPCDRAVGLRLSVNTFCAPEGGCTNPRAMRMRRRSLSSEMRARGPSDGWDISRVL